MRKEIRGEVMITREQERPKRESHKAGGFIDFSIHQGRMEM